MRDSEYFKWMVIEIYKSMTANVTRYGVHDECLCSSANIFQPNKNQTIHSYRQASVVVASQADTPSHRCYTTTFMYCVHARILPQRLRVVAAVFALVLYIFVLCYDYRCVCCLCIRMSNFCLFDCIVKRYMVGNIYVCQTFPKSSLTHLPYDTISCQYRITI